MPETRRTYIKHIFGGGWATAFGPTAVQVAPDQNGFVTIPYLVEAEDTLYELSGGLHKIPGTEKLNSTTLESGAAIRGLYDFWRQGVGGSPTQKRIAYVNGVIYKDDADGNFSAIKTGLQDTVVPNFNTFDDLLIIANDSVADVPMSYDGTTFQNLAGTPPNFAFSETFKNSVFAAGVVTAPSTLYFSNDLDPENWTSGTSGSISIDPNDGDKITALLGHKDSLFVFKGPNKGSIHRVTGTTFGGGSADIVRSTFVKGVGTVGPNATFSLGDDIGFWWSDGTLRSLQATSAFGDFREASLSFEIQEWLDDHLTFNALDTIQTATDATGRRVYFALPIDSSTTPNIVLVMDARFNPPRWSKIPSYDATSLAQVRDSNKLKVFLGSSDGFIRKTANPTRSIDGTTALAYNVLTPYMHYGIPQKMKTLEGISLGMAPHGSGNITFAWQRDNNTQQSVSVTASGSDAVLAPAPPGGTDFVLGTHTLGGAAFLDVFAATEEGGEFRTIQYQLTNSTIGEDTEIHSFGTSISVGAESWEN